MQTIQLHATAQQDFHIPEKVELVMTATLAQPQADLDEALAIVLQAVRQSKNPRAMDALGDLLGYMETLERTQPSKPSQGKHITLANPITLSL